ncbi:Guanine nucleotide-binding protein subunit beta-like protein-like [Forsythia ovata]|uniref:Guanine nucleotide-binding protein subunit beta-like protein-like n=1 Tax=Forsythia ovata TaxID=205694 RepID=A0ABD1WRT3_9LAMI
MAAIFELSGSNNERELVVGYKDFISEPCSAENTRRRGGYTTLGTVVIKVWNLESKNVVMDLKVDLKQESEMAAEDTTQATKNKSDNQLNYLLNYFLPNHLVELVEQLILSDLVTYIHVGGNGFGLK